MREREIVPAKNLAGPLAFNKTLIRRGFMIPKLSSPESSADVIPNALHRGPYTIQLMASKNWDYKSNQPKKKRPPLFSVERVRQYVDKQLTSFERGMGAIVGHKEAVAMGKAALFTSLLVDIGVLTYVGVTVAHWVLAGTNPIYGLIALLTLFPPFEYATRFLIKLPVILVLYGIGKITRILSGKK